MYREKIKELEEWKKLKDRMPLIIRGARQVGKTWIMKEFGKNNYENVAYINFDGNDRMARLFEGDFDINRIIQGLKVETGVDIDKKNTLLIFDEIQEVPKALTSLKYFCENANEYSIIAAGSLLGVALHEGTSFPVGKVDFIDLYPLNFEEFLLAQGEEKLVEILNEQNWDLINIFKDKFVLYLREYYFIGGMPSAVNKFVESKDYKQVRKVQLKLLQAYEEDFSKHAPNEIVPRLKMLWNSIPAQLAKENKKFIYGLIKEGARAKEYELALSWLMDCGLIYKIDRVNKPNIPLIAYQDTSAFKLYILDVGLLGAMTRIDEKIILEGSKIFTEFKGSFTEQFVLTELKSNKDIPIFYWSAERATAEIDFVVQSKGYVIPIEVKSEENLQAKSLKEFVSKYDTEINVRTSMTDYKKEDWLINIPLYNIGNIEEII
ncbi:MAG: ATP-binding protein [Clostridia bacterium]